MRGNRLRLSVTEVLQLVSLFFVYLFIFCFACSPVGFNRLNLGTFGLFAAIRASGTLWSNGVERCDAIEAFSCSMDMTFHNGRA